MSPSRFPRVASLVVAASPVVAASLVALACGGGTSSANAPDPASQPRIACPKSEVMETITNDQGAHHDRHEQLFADAKRRVLDFHFQRQPDDCHSARVVAARVLRKAPESSDEAWIVESCERECFEYRVNVKPMGRAFGLQIRVPGE